MNFAVRRSSPSSSLSACSIVIHELGHYWVARRCGVKVLRFSIGFGRPLLRWVAAPTGPSGCWRRSRSAATCRMLDEREADAARSSRADLPRAFNRQSGRQAHRHRARRARWPTSCSRSPCTGCSMSIGVLEPRAVLGAAAAATRRRRRRGCATATPCSTPTAPRCARGTTCAGCCCRKRSTAATSRSWCEAPTASRATLRLDLRGVTEADLDGSPSRALGLGPTAVPPRARAHHPTAARRERAGLREGDRVARGRSAAGRAPRASSASASRAAPASRSSSLIERDGQQLLVRRHARARDRRAAATRVGRIGVRTRRAARELDNKVRYGPIDEPRRRRAQGPGTRRSSRCSMLGQMIVGEASWKNLRVR